MGFYLENIWVIVMDDKKIKNKEDLALVIKNLEEEINNFKEMNDKNSKQLDKTVMSMMDNCMVVFTKLIDFEKENKRILENQFILNKSYKYIMIVLVIVVVIGIMNLFI